MRKNKNKNKNKNKKLKFCLDGRDDQSQRWNCIKGGKTIGSQIRKKT
jgi:hypothetical protein